VTERSRGAVSEFELIDRIRRRALSRDDVILGIGDDAAVLQVPAGKHLVIATDTINRGVHFPDDTGPYEVGWKALAVNLSDLAAMGAEPAWCALSLSLPHADMAWVDSFLDPGLALRRGGARIGDDVWVSGTLGDATGALMQWSAGAPVDPVLRRRLDCPTPRVRTGQAIAAVAHACIDVSDGLLADLQHVCDASHVGAEIRLEALPMSPSLDAAFDLARRYAAQATGGDDYELCFTAPPDARAAIEQIAQETTTLITRVGHIVAGQGVRALQEYGRVWEPPSKGFVHFADG
jgi:thiamine-monophosphate kinase